MAEGPAVSDAARRHWVLAGVGAAAAIAGSGVAWWRFRPSEASGSAGAERLWPLRLATPQGSEVDLAKFRGRPLLVNFWATWCPPCVEEMPLLDAFYRQHQANGWQVVGLAVDQPSAVRTWLQRTPIAFPILMAGLEGTDLSRSLGNLAGGLPFTVVVGKDGGIVQRRIGRVTQADLNAWAGLA